MEELEIINEQIPTEEISEEAIAEPIAPDDNDSQEDITPINPKEHQEESQVGDEADTLRQELLELRASIESRKQKEEKALRELEEFNRLYPEVNVDALEEGVWEKVNEGLPLSAAYAIHQREQELLKEFADRINTRNANLSAGSAGASPRQEYYSPDEVKCMSGEEVRKNYSIIKRSMNYWRKALK